MSDWIAQARSAPIVDAASSFGIELGRNRSLGPCPHCGCERRGSTDTRAPIGMNASGDGWRCHKCGAAGDVVDLVAYCIVGRRLRDCQTTSQQTIVNWFKERGYVKDNAMPAPKQENKKITKSRPPKKEVQGLWLSTALVGDVLEVCEFLAARDFDIQGVSDVGFVRVSPAYSRYKWPKWWPSVWAKSYRLMTPAYDVDGNFVSLHARAVKQVKDGQGKTRWPKGFESGGLFMANRAGVKLLKGHKLDELRGVLICEGLTDLLRASVCALQSGLPIAIIAGTSGSFQHLSNVRIPKDVNVYTAMDPDTQGAKYLSQIRKALSSHQVRPIPLPEN